MAKDEDNAPPGPILPSGPPLPAEAMPLIPIRPRVFDSYGIEINYGTKPPTIRAGPSEFPTRHRAMTPEEAEEHYQRALVEQGQPGTRYRGMTWAEWLAELDRRGIRTWGGGKP